MRATTYKAPPRGSRPWLWPWVVSYEALRARGYTRRRAVVVCIHAFIRGEA